jgi:hypothetical protein
MPASFDRRWVAATVSMAILSAVLGGCETRVASTEVNGRVTLDSKPLAGVTVAFFPHTKGIDPSLVGRGTTDSTGRYTLSGPEGLAGAVVGTNRVVVLPPRTPRSSGDSTTGPTRRIPMKYSSPQLTPLEVVVQAGGPQTIDLALNSK